MLGDVHRGQYTIPRGTTCISRCLNQPSCTCRRGKATNDSVALGMPIFRPRVPRAPTAGTYMWLSVLTLVTVMLSMLKLHLQPKSGRGPACLELFCGS